ncbi:MAG: hypothetical protein ACK4VO_02930 [Pseudobdellovibrio sp.]
MGRYLIIDTEEKSIELIKENLGMIDAQSILETFTSLTSLKQVLQNKTSEEQKLFWTFNLIILDYTMLEPKIWTEEIENIKKQNTQDFVFLFTGYDDPGLSFKHVRSLGAYNFLFKPYDPLILKESLNIATQIGKRVQSIEMKPQEASAFVGLLKEVDLQSISELGFVTLSDGELPLNTISKYFSPIFLLDKKQSVWAQCLVSLPHPQKPGTFINKFQFIATDLNFLNHIRRFVQNHKQAETSSALWNFNQPQSTVIIKVAIVALENDDTHLFTQAVHDHFENVQAEIIKLDPNKKNAAEILDHDIVINMTDIKFDNIKSYFKENAQFFLVSPSTLKEDDLKILSSQYRDMYSQPFDRYYLFKKMKIHTHDLRQKEPTHLINVSTREKMKAALKVKISDICEVSVNFIYNRELPLRTFREFIFLTDDETKLTELRGICHYTEKAQSTEPGAGPSFFHQYMFYGMTDHYLKQIRIWLLQNYIVTHQKNE